MSEKSPRYWLCYLSTIWIKCQADLKVSMTFYSCCWLISTISRELSPFFSKFIRRLTFQTFCSKFSSKLKVHPKIPNSPMLICVRVYVCVCVCSSSCYCCFCCFCHWFVCDFSRKWLFLRIPSGQSHLKSLPWRPTVNFADFSIWEFLAGASRALLLLLLLLPAWGQQQRARCALDTVDTHMLLLEAEKYISTGELNSAIACAEEVRIYTHIYARAHAHIHPYTHTHIHTHTH